MCSEKNCLAENVLEAYENNGTAHQQDFQGEDLLQVHPSLRKLSLVEDWNIRELCPGLGLGVQ